MIILLLYVLKCRRGNIMEITQCEKIIMDIIWEADHELALQEIIDKVNANRKREWGRKAVSAFLRRLEKKSFVVKYRQKGIVFYQPLFDREEIVSFLTISKPYYHSPFL